MSQNRSREFGRRESHEAHPAFHPRLWEKPVAAVRYATGATRALRLLETILPGSKRLLAVMKIFGDNTDVRPPRDEEVWRGGGVGSGGGGSNSTDSSGLRSVVLVIDGVFFVDGEFIGPNQMYLWEDVYYEADAKLQAARIAAAGKARGLSTAEIMINIDRYTGPLPERGGLPPMASRESLTPEDFRRWHRGQLATWFSHLRKQQQEDQVVNLLISWLDMPPPKLRRS